MLRLASVFKILFGSLYFEWSLCQSIGITLIMKNNATIGGNNVIQFILKNKLKISFSLLYCENMD
ncbi:hypothetical protein [Candidatus Phytoplasma tritici]|uniref:hypothetical protein n=1 Tax=Candidatus Phytoplasma tritici TaxID=321961 RepID=UPI000417E734|nr:hypothetical protein [Candidatus Phytoplasma tritici]